MKTKIKTHASSIDNIVVLIVFCTFAFSVLMVLMLAAGVYRNISEITQSSENERTAYSYVRTKIRNADSAGAFYVAEFDGLSALYISEQIGGTEYQTVIYVYDGWLCELFSEASIEHTPADGTRITPAGGLAFTMSDSMIHVITDRPEGIQAISIYPRTGGHSSGWDSPVQGGEGR